MREGAGQPLSGGRGVARRRVGASAACLALLPLIALLPALAALGVLILVVVGLGVMEEMVRRRPVGRSGDGQSDRGAAARSNEDRDHGARDQSDRGPVAAD